MKKLALVLALACIVTMTGSLAPAFFAWAPYMGWGGGYGSSGSSSGYWPGAYSSSSSYYGYPVYGGYWSGVPWGASSSSGWSGGPWGYAGSGWRSGVCGSSGYWY